ncbi:unnamed protein product [Meloidogyne enterolobii]|uniref:Uncharacterized protein n=1 Tax=Meloidogyne enterolobii TaxID=390850 RepID=A0ACB0ZHU4_MELEN
MFEFKATLSNDNKEIKECLQAMPDGFNANLVPFAYSIGIERFEKLKEGPYEEGISCDKKDECVKSGGECLKPGALEFGWAYNGDKVHVGMQPIGEPVVCEHPSENLVDNLKSEINVHVDDGIYWFKIENFETGFYLTNSRCHSFVCINRYGIIVVQKKLIKPIAWEIKNQSLQFDSRYRQLLAFYLSRKRLLSDVRGTILKGILL